MENNISPAGSKGSQIVNAYQGRTMKIFPISESELNNLSIMNGLSTFCFSISAYFLPDFTKKPAMGDFLSISIILPLILGLIFMWKRHGILKIIEKEVTQYNKNQASN